MAMVGLGLVLNTTVPVMHHVAIWVYETIVGNRSMINHLDNC